MVLRLLAKIIPLIGESITSEWKAHMTIFYPFLQSKWKPIQMAVERCLLVMVTIDSSIGEDVLVDLVNVLSDHIDGIEKTQQLEVEK